MRFFVKKTLTNFCLDFIIISYKQQGGDVIMYKAYKFRLYPSDSQKELIHKTFGCTRFIYNYFLDECMKNGFIKVSNVVNFNLT